MTLRSKWAAVLAVVVAAIALPACGSDSDEGSTSSSAATSATSAAPAAGVDPEAAALVPEDLREKSEVTVAFDASTPPFEYIDRDGKTVVGIDPDLAKAIFPLLGLEPKLVNATFDTIIPGLQSGKFDIGMSSMTDTKERERVVDFVTYLTAGTQFFARAESNLRIDDVLDTCGLTVAVQSGGYQREVIAEKTRECAGLGRDEIEAAVFPTQNAANLALSSGRVDTAFADSPVAGYQVLLSRGRFVLASPVFDTAPFGIAVSKDSGTLDEAIQVALRKLMADGGYDEIFSRWGIENSAIRTPEINGAIN